MPPANCAVQAQGEWAADGMHVHFETNIEAHGSGQVDLKTGKATGDATVKSAASRTDPSRSRLRRLKSRQPELCDFRVSARVPVHDGSRKKQAATCSLSSS